MSTKLLDPQTRADEVLRERHDAERDSIAQQLRARDEHEQGAARCNAELPLAQAAAEAAEEDVARAIAQCAPAEEALRQRYAQVAELRVHAEKKRRDVLTLRAELQAHQRALDAYEFDRHGCLLPHDLERALSRIHRDDASPNLLLTDGGRVGIVGDAQAITALVLHESHLPSADLREYRQRLADVLR